MSNEHRTAIARRGPSKPVKWLEQNNRIVGRVLDYGCGRGADAEYLGCASYDPYYQPDMPVGLFDTITCNYVFNVIEDDRARRVLLWDLDGYLAPGGRAFIAVRANRKDLRGHTRIGTWQGLITLDLPIVYKDSDTVIYKLCRGDADCNMKAEVT